MTEQNNLYSLESNKLVIPAYNLDVVSITQK
jgi:hypothetical protein